MQATSGAEPGTEPPSCAEVLEAQGEAERDEKRGDEPEVVDVSVSGNRARAAIERTAGVSQSITLETVDGEWRISAFEG